MNTLCKFGTIIFLMFSILAAQAQQRSCCTQSANGLFADLGNDNSFVNSHHAPMPMEYGGVGAMIQYPTIDGQTASAYEIKSKVKSNRVLLVIHEWWGLNDYIKREADELAAQIGDVTVLALDLYDGGVATDAEGARGLMQGVKDARARAIVQGAIAYAGKGASIGTVGWCFGGGWSMQASLIAGKQAKACVIYYGMPEEDEKKVAMLSAPVLGIFAKNDGWISSAVVEKFEKNMKAAGKSLTVKMYDADHAFANPSNPKYNKSAGDDAHAATVGFFKKHLK